VVQNADAFTARYGSGKPVAGSWSANDRLSNSSETITLQFGLATPPIISITYNDDPALNWPIAADGPGFSLVRIQPEDSTRDANLGVNWRSSLTITGNPGSDDRVSYAAWLAGTPEGDPDHDNLPNLIEYALGGDALSDSSAIIPHAAWQTLIVEGIPGTYATLSFRRSNAHEDFSQRVEFSSDLQTWPFAGIQVSANDLGDGTRHEVWRMPTPALPAASGSRIYGRLRITRP
jgi:hypothetical protein